jgi:ATPase family associated with various cellular activities (AAA)
VTRDDAHEPFAAELAWVRDLLVAGWERQVAEGRYQGDDPFRRLRVDAERAAAVASGPFVPPPAPRTADPPNDGSWPESCGRLGLDVVERSIATIAVAVELEPRLRPLVAALQDDAGLRHPAVSLLDELLELVGPTPGARLPARRALAPGGRLLRLGLVRFHVEEGRPSRGDHLVVSDEWLVDVAAGRAADARGTTTPVATAAPAVAGHRTDRPTLLTGADPVARAGAFGACLGAAEVVVVDLTDECAAALGAADDQRLAEGARRARVAGTALVVHAASVTPALTALLEPLAALGTTVAVSVVQRAAAAPAGWGHLMVAPPTRDHRRQAWRRALEQGRRPLAAPELAAVEEVAANASVGLDAIAAAAQRVVDTVPADRTIDRTALKHAVRQTAWSDLSAVARYVENRHGWSDLVVADHTRRQLEEIVGSVQHLGTVVEEWGFGDRPGGLGLHLLFAGPSGTGKTLSASVIASECELDLWVVDLARVVDKYLGETEKQLDRVLGAAERCGAMLLFDEADALFGRRGEVREAKDRWANVEVAYLLQRIEQHRGVTVLTTNLGQHLDVAFARRMGHRVEFAVPDVALRRELWRRSVPDQAPVADEAAFGVIAERFELAGGAIRNAALNAAFAAAQDGRAIELDHLVLATVRELVKLGKPPTRSELADLPAAALVP